MDGDKDKLDLALYGMGMTSMAMATHCGIACHLSIREYLSTIQSNYGISIYPKRCKNYTNSRLYFYLIAKELYLSGYSVSILSLTFLMHICEKFYIKEYLKNTGIFNNHYIFISDFCEEVYPGPIQGKEGLLLYRLLQDIKNKNIGIFTLSSVDHSRWADKGWWGKAYLSSVLKDNAILRVGEEKDVEWFKINSFNN